MLPDVIIECQPIILKSSLLYIAESNQMISDLRPFMIKGSQKADLRYPIEQDVALTYCVKVHYGGRLE